ncbi:MAG: hypothetical protein ACI30R_11130 [Sodaliphilus sp.]
MDELMQRQSPERIKVTLPNGQSICYSSSKQTFIETLKLISPLPWQELNIEICHLPLFSTTIYEKYKTAMEDIGHGWYVNTQSTVRNKSAQLKLISAHFNLGLQVEVSQNLKGDRVPKGKKTTRALQVEFPDGTIIADESPVNTFVHCIQKIGIDKVVKSRVQYVGKDLITSTQKSKNQIQIEENRWLTTPNIPKERVKLLNVLSIHLHLKLKITYS